MQIRACEHLQKYCEHEQANTHLIFASNSASKRQILQALSNRMGPFDTPSSVYIYVWIYENGVREFAPHPGEGEDIEIKRKASLFPLHSFIFLLMLSSPYFFPLLHGLEAAFGSCEIKVDNLMIWIVWPKFLTPFSKVLSFIFGRFFSLIL